MKTPRALLTAIAAAALSFAIVIGTAATMATAPDAGVERVAQQTVSASAQQMAYVPDASDATWNADCDIAL